MCQETLRFYHESVVEGAGLSCLFERTNVDREQHKLFTRQLLVEGRHLATTVSNGIENSFVGHSLLPLGVSEICSAHDLPVGGISSAI